MFLAQIIIRTFLIETFTTTDQKKRSVDFSVCHTTWFLNISKKGAGRPEIQTDLRISNRLGIEIVKDCTILETNRNSGQFLVFLFWILTDIDQLQPKRNVLNQNVDFAIS